LKNATVPRKQLALEQHDNGAGHHQKFPDLAHCKIFFDNSNKSKPELRGTSGGRDLSDGGTVQGLLRDARRSKDR
jgi:hypothetical protein